MALDPEVWERSDGVRFGLVVVEGGTRRELGEALITPAGRVSDQRWVPYEVEFATTTASVSVALVIDVGPAGRGDFDRAYWAEPRVATLARPPLGELTLLGLLGVIVAAIAAWRRELTLAPDWHALAFFAYSLIVSVLLTEIAWPRPRPRAVREGPTARGTAPR